MVQTILLSASVFLLICYLAVFMAIQGIPSSISATYYKCETKWLFPAILVSSVALAIGPLFDLTPENWQFLGFFIAASVLFVAASPAFKDEFVGKIHSGAAIVGGIAIVSWLMAVSNILFLLPVIIAIALDRKRWVFWFEICLLAALYTTLFILLIG